MRLHGIRDACRCQICSVIVLKILAQLYPHVALISRVPILTLTLHSLTLVLTCRVLYLVFQNFYAIPDLSL